jgi:very-short-patch-repair endonuclease
MNEAQKKDGILWKRNRERCIEKHGVTHQFSSPEIREKASRTCIEKYGVANPSQAECVRKKRSETLKKTFAARGNEIREQRMVSNLENLGVPWPMMSQDVRDKSRSSFSSRYGADVKCAMDIKEVVERTDFAAAAAKRHESMKRNGTYKTSKPEDQIYGFLCEKYGTDNVIRQATIEKWPIDFYVKTIDTYIQVDGTYWHGHGRTKEELMNSEHPRDSIILRKKITDEEQAVWFKKHSKKLVRITDEQIKGGEFSL